MKIPSKVKVGGHEFKVELVDSVEESSHNSTFGQIDGHTNVIKILRSVPQSQQEETLLHEIVHAIDWNLSENKVNDIAFKLYAVLKDNDFLK